jgi:hypothetical protein
MVSNLPSFEEVEPFLPGTFKDIYCHFPNVSSRGLRNQLNVWAKQSKLFIKTCENGKPGKPGKPANFYTLTGPESEFDLLISEFDSVVKEFCRAWENLKVADDKTESVFRLILAYKKLGDLKLNAFTKGTCNE